MATAAANSREWVSETSIALARRRLGRPAGEAHRRRLAGDDLDLAQAEAAAEAERLDHRLLGGEAGREVAARAGPGRGVVALGLGEDALGEARVALQRPLQPVDLEQVDADPGAPSGPATLPGRRSASPSPDVALGARADRRGSRMLLQVRLRLLEVLVVFEVGSSASTRRSAAGAVDEAADRRAAERAETASL